MPIAVKQTTQTNWKALDEHVAHGLLPLSRLILLQPRQDEALNLARQTLPAPPETILTGNVLSTRFGQPNLTHKDKNIWIFEARDEAKPGEPSVFLVLDEAVLEKRPVLAIRHDAHRRSLPTGRAFEQSLKAAAALCAACHTPNSGPA